MWKFLTDIVEKFLQDPKKFFHFSCTLLLVAALALVLFLLISLPVFMYYRIDPRVFFTSKVKTGQIGLIDYAAKSVEFSDDRSRLISEAKREIFYVGTVFYRTPKENEKTILEAIAKGRKVRFLVADPRGKYFEANASFFGDTKEGLAEESEDTFKGYLKIKNQLTESKYSNGSIELRIIDRVFPSALYFYDPQEPTGQLELVARDFDTNAPEMPAFRFAAVAGGVVERYFRSAEYLWNEAIPYEKWVAEGHN